MRFAVLVLAGSAAASTAQLDARQAGAGAAAPTDCVAAVKSALSAVPSAPSQLADKLERTGLRPNNCGEFSGLPKDVEAEYNGYRSSLLSWMNSYATSLAKCPGAQDKLREKLQNDSEVPASCFSNYPALQTFFPANPTGGSGAGQATATASTGGAKAASSTATGQAASTTVGTLATSARSGQAGLGSNSTSTSTRSGGLSTSTRVGLAARETGMAMAAVAVAGLAIAAL
ncbi:hypothetical protein AAL_04259 [Moelleriella libera RCEF 2490]|uniref:Infection structure specific protein n=1 Tax=Moelleriella libera RCEF 2490 TaxID=1081109 RepID=A0A162INE7_9HYPO|nr:hypothetical protein AAL_04259 [Moelleriella libera RCEF 2490]